MLNGMMTVLNGLMTALNGLMTALNGMDGMDGMMTVLSEGQYGRQDGRVTALVVDSNRASGDVKHCFFWQ